MRLTKQCHSCKQEFRKTELVDYATPGTKTMYSYCSKCLEEKHKREAFAKKVCMIFGLKSPGPRIWTERKRLIDTYGYTDDTIVDCLDYIYNIEHKKKLVESICLVNPSTINKMINYKQTKVRQMTQALGTETKEYVVPIKEKIVQKDEWNPDDWLDDE